MASSRRGCGSTLLRSLGIVAFFAVLFVAGLGFFLHRALTLRYFEATGRTKAQVHLLHRYCAAQGLFGIPAQGECDYYYERLTAGGEILPCGWLKDKFGMVWQVTPAELIKMISDPDRVKAQRAMQVMMTQKKLEIAPIKKAFEGH